MVGDRNMTKDQFVDQWVGHAKQLYNLSLRHDSAIASIVNQVKGIAESEFDRIYELNE